MAAHERLSSLDQAFLSFETSTTHMHIALTAIFESGPLAGHGGGIDVERIRRHIASRLHLCPRYRQRLASMPVTGDPVWVDDDRFDLDYHVRHASLPRPGDEGQLRRRCEEVLERPLDRARPLWETWIIEGVAGRRFAMLTKVHHCLVDGVGGVGILTTLLSLAPEQASAPAPPWAPRAIPGTGEMLGHEFLRRGRGLLAAGRAARDPVTLLEGVRRRTTAVCTLLASGLRSPPRTPLNGTVGTHRRVRWLSFPLTEVKAVKRALGGTMNDVVLATVASGLRRFLLAHRAGVGLDDFRVAVPVNCRGDGDGPAGNCTSIWLLPLPLTDADPYRRLRAIRATTGDFKAEDRAEGVRALADAAEWIGANALHWAVRMIARASPYNLVVTNVPGPPVPLYLLGARMEAAYPYLPLFQSQGLGIALFSYRDRLNWGLTGDWDALPDIEQLGHALEEAFAELRLMAAASLETPAERDDARTATRPDATGRNARGKDLVAPDEILALLSRHGPMKSPPRLRPAIAIGAQKSRS